MTKKSNLNGKQRVLVISDLQAPAHHPDALEFLKACKKLIKPTKVVCIGDITDQHALSFHIRYPDLPSANDEFEQAQVFLNSLYKVFPKCTILTSNHDMRIMRVAETSGIPSRCLKEFLDVIEAPSGWDMEEHITIDDVLYVHGDTGRGGMNSAIKQAMDNFTSVVKGHDHAQFEISYYANKKKIIFGMTVGSLLNQKHIAFKYAKKFTKKSIMGTGAVLYGHPVLIPMELDDKGRWTGQLPQLVSKRK